LLDNSRDLADVPAKYRLIGRALDTGGAAR
jgi:hypothetical protein